MTQTTRRASNGGFTLLEMMLAAAIFTIILGATAQGLISYYVSLDMQNQKNVALSDCRAVLDDMRALRDATNDFPGALVERWPDGATIPGFNNLPGETVVVDYVDPTANPLEISVTANWRSIRGHPVSLRLSTALTNR